MFWSVPLRDGRTIQIRHQPLPNGDWVSTHEDITELSAPAPQRTSGCSSKLSSTGCPIPLGEGYREPLCRREQSVSRGDPRFDAERDDWIYRFALDLKKQHGSFV